MINTFFRWIWHSPISYVRINDLLIETHQRLKTVVIIGTLLAFVSVMSIARQMPALATNLHGSSSAQAPPSLTPAELPSANTGILRDPTGTYAFIYLGNSEYSINQSAYEKLLGDPYSGISHSGDVQFVGGMVIITVPSSNITNYPTDTSP
jgi:hypothetical protein